VSGVNLILSHHIGLGPDWSSTFGGFQGFGGNIAPLVCNAANRRVVSFRLKVFSGTLLSRCLLKIVFDTVHPYFLRICQIPVH